MCCYVVGGFGWTLGAAGLFAMLARQGHPRLKAKEPAVEMFDVRWEHTGAFFCRPIANLLVHNVRRHGKVPLEIHPQLRNTLTRALRSAGTASKKAYRSSRLRVIRRQIRTLCPGRPRNVSASTVSENKTLGITLCSSVSPRLAL